MQRVQICDQEQKPNRSQAKNAFNSRWYLALCKGEIRTPAKIVHKHLQTSKTSGHSHWCSLREIWKTFRHKTKFAKAHKSKASRSTYWGKSRRRGGRGGHSEHKYWPSWQCRCWRLGSYSIWPFDWGSLDFRTSKWFVAIGTNAKWFRPSFFGIRLE